MVHQPFTTSSSVKHSHKLFRLLLLIFCGSAIIATCLLFISSGFKQRSDSPDSQTDTSTLAPDNDNPSASEESDGTEKELPDAVDFSISVESFTNSINGKSSVIIYDLDRQEMAFEFNASEVYNTASLYKLFVVYEGYRRLERGDWNPEDNAGSTGHTIIQCLDLAIRESNSRCAETIWNMIGHKELDDIVKNDFKIDHSMISQLTSPPEDILAIMKLFYYHPDFSSPELVTRMLDSFLNQPKTEYDWRQGLPSGFSRAKVYNKVGWDYNSSGRYWNIYHDAAIIEFPEENRHFIVIVMTSQVPLQKIAELGSNIEKAFYQELP